MLPQFGGKISSILVRGMELLQAPLLPIGPRTQTMSFDAGDASGWDECLPSVSGCTVTLANGSTAEIPDHGDLWRVPWQVLHSSNGSVSMCGECFSLPLKLHRTITLTQTEKGYRLQADYKVTNTCATETPWAWSAHPGYLAEEGDRLELPESIQSLRLEWSRNNRLGKGGDTVRWPLAQLTARGESDLRVSTEAHSGVGDKLFAGPLIAKENWCSLTRPKAGVRLRIGFDAAATPFLGLWICQDGYPEGDGAKQHCVAMEPTTAPVDSLAITGPWSRVLAAGESYFWPMTVDIELL
jgi:galactose mutarotase-like enzyme